MAGKRPVGVRWPHNPRALVGRLRRAQTYLRTLGIEIAFRREGWAGTRIIRMNATPDNPPRKIVSSVGNDDLRGQDIRRQSEEVSSNPTCNADGADAADAQSVLDSSPHRPSAIPDLEHCARRPINIC
jgi:hypothetical protein